MLKIRLLKIRTTIVTLISKLTGTFNRRIKEIKTEYNRNYFGDRRKHHALDVMYHEEKSGLPCVLYMHGGGWTAYDKRVFRSTCKRLAKGGTIVFNCNYRLAPKYTIWQMQEDVAAIFRFICENAQSYGGDPKRIIFAGDSAGAHLLSLFINRAVKEGDSAVYEKVKACVFFYGVYDLATARNTGFKHLDEYMSAVIPPTTPDYEKKLEELSPVTYAGRGLPPTFICSGKIDLLNASQSETYIKVLESYSVPVHSLIFPESCKQAKHKFITFDTNKAAIKAFEAFDEFIKTI